MFSVSHREPAHGGEGATASLATADRAACVYVCVCVWLAQTNPQGNNISFLLENTHTHIHAYTTYSCPIFSLLHRQKKKWFKRFVLVDKEIKDIKAVSDQTHTCFVPFQRGDSSITCYRQISHSLSTNARFQQMSTVSHTKGEQDEI